MLEYIPSKEALQQLAALELSSCYHFLNNGEFACLKSHLQGGEEFQRDFAQYLNKKGLDAESEPIVRFRKYLSSQSTESAKVARVFCQAFAKLSSFEEDNLSVGQLSVAHLGNEALLK